MTINNKNQNKDCSTENCDQKNAQKSATQKLKPIAQKSATSALGAYRGLLLLLQPTGAYNIPNIPSFQFLQGLLITKMVRQSKMVIHYFPGPYGGRHRFLGAFSGNVCEGFGFRVMQGY